MEQKEINLDELAEKILTLDDTSELQERLNALSQREAFVLGLICGEKAVLFISRQGLAKVIEQAKRELL